MSQDQSISSTRKSSPRPENQFLLNESGPTKNGSTPSGSRKVVGGPGNGDPTEKQPLFERTGPIIEPVRLTPAWEETNLPNDELNFKGVTMERARLEMNPPRDRYNLIYLIFVLHGIGILMPWNMFITAKSYFVDYKLSQEYTHIENTYANNFLSWIGFAAQVPNLLFNWLNIFIAIGGNLTTRIIWSIMIEVVIFILTVVFAMSDTSDYPGAFFFTTMVTVVILNMANGIYQNTVFGLAAKLPFKYSGAIILGSNISGTLTALINIMAIWAAPNARTAAIYYFITALFILLTCFDTYFALPLNRYYRYHELKHEKEQDSRIREALNQGTTQSQPYFYIFRQCLPQLFNVFFIFFVTLAIFPAVHSDIVMSDPEFFISKQYFTPVTCFLTFNLCAMLGSSLATVFAWPGERFLVIPVLIRVLFLPFFLLCNYQPAGIARAIPVLINSDIVYWIGAILLGLTGGYYSSLGMMYTPRCVEPQYRSTAGMFGGAALITGIFTGILFSMVPSFIVKLSFT